MFAEGPRQVINALTLYSVMQANLVPVGEHAPKKGGSAAAQFFINVRILANHNKEQAAILFGMLFTLVVWAIAAISLILAALCYILFLWHYIPTADDGLSGYCRRKVDSRLHKIVGVKVKRALAIDSRSRPGSKSRTVKDGATPARLTRQPTFPMLDIDAEDKQKEPPISRRTTETTLPLYTSTTDKESHGRSKHNIRAEPIIPYLPPFQNRPAPFSRTTTSSSAHSNRSFASDAPLLRTAEEMGYGPSPDSHSAAASFGPGSGRQPPPSTERNLIHISNSMQRSAFRLPRSQGRNTPGSTLTGHPSLEKPWQSEISSSSTHFHSAKENDYFGVTQGPSPLDRPGGRIARPSEHPSMGTQNYDVRHRPITDQVDGSSSDSTYVAFNPHHRTGFAPRNPAMGQTRNFAMPFNRPSHSIPQQQIVSHQLSTASNPPNSQILRNPTFHPHSEAPAPANLPSRAATTSPSAPAWDGSKMFH